MVRQAWVVGGWVIGVASLLACGGSGASGGEPEAPAPQGDIARVHRSRCGSCHLRVEPGERTREQLETALARHRRRVRLTPEQWDAMVDYLAVK